MTEPKLPPLNAIRAFDAAARHGGFRAAADALNVSHGVIGRHVRLLEKRIGVTLFATKNRGVELTEEGRYYHATITKALRMISRATAELEAESSTKLVRIVAVPGLASKWLGPRLRHFTERHPKTRVVIVASDSFEDVQEGDADFGIGYGARAEFSGNLELLARPKVFPVASPAYIEKHGPFRDIHDLHNADCLDEDFGGWWDLFFEENGLISDRASQLVFSSASQAVDAALADQGIALVNPFLAEPHLQTSALIRVTDLEFDGGAYWIIRPQGKTANHVVDMCIEWILEEAGHTHTH
ncbi:MAG: LysR substrate-binding domain-containing protein [Pseudomonadota bacterium]